MLTKGFGLIAFMLSLNILFTHGSKEGSSNPVQEWDDRLLLLSTLDGSLYGVEHKTGHVRWTLKEEPVVKVPVNTDKSVIPLFLPDPVDGSLYILRASNMEPLTKLPFTIPELVASSPCKSSDGILYTGKKLDTWLAIDTRFGTKQEVMNSGKTDACPPLSLSPDTIFIGRTEYNIMMLDSKQKEKTWNITFYDYSYSVMDTKTLSEYEYVHFTVSSMGRMVTMDRRFGSILWEHDYGSPVIAVYLLENDNLISVPFRTVGEETLGQLVSHFISSAEQDRNNLKLYETLYIGEHPHGLYALPSLVDHNTVTIGAMQAGMLLLEGPQESQLGLYNGRHVPLPGENVRVNPNPAELPVIFQSLPKEKGATVTPYIILGHYKAPERNRNILQIAGRSDPVIEPVADNKTEHSLPPTQTQGFVMVITDWFIHQENKVMKLMLMVAFGIIGMVLWYLHVQLREVQMSHGSKSSSTGTNSNTNITALAEDLGEGNVKVGKIMFNVDDILGKGCEGTFVFRGKFDNRAVAVKRVLPECFTFADREVSLLRESDEHFNVVRYFCMEQDKQFRYIALELCAATLQNFVEGSFRPDNITPLDILYQATAGLQHLHSLDIVHRDIKPHNVLLSVPSKRGEVRAMISDFGLCKKLQVGRMSFSRRSGLAGTDGWIAPEMLIGHARTTCAVDIFSLGCVFYYVLSNGKHPFGDPIHRQGNIMANKFNLTALDGESNLLYAMLVETMIHFEPRERPPATAVLKHPIFWTKSHILTFLQDVSDRVEKDDPESSDLLQALESNSVQVVREDWRLQVDAEVAQDLRKYRNYSGTSVRDLLRALRNKKHHYRELTQEAQQILGQIPTQFTEYWTERFPLLVLHSWLTMQRVKHEPVFLHYYDKRYKFSDVWYKGYIKTLPYKEEENWRFRDSPSKQKCSWREDAEQWQGVKHRTRARKKPRNKQVEMSVDWMLPE